MENISSPQKLIIGMQMLFVAFGNLVLVPLLTGLDPSIALLTAGIGTLIFQLITKSMVPVFLASSFAFVAPIKAGVEHFGVGATLGGLASAGLVYLFIAGLIKLRGVSVIERYLPPIVTGPVILIIGLKLAPVAVDMCRSFSGTDQVEWLAIVIALVSLITTIIVVLKGKGMMSLIPIFTGIVVGFILSVFAGVVDFSPVKEAQWFAIPWAEALRTGSYTVPVFNIQAVMFILPVAIAPAIEHVGDIIAISSVTGNDYLEKPGLHRTLAGDGIATTVASLLGGPPNTTYSEVTGAVALLRVFDPVLMRVAAVFAIFLAFFGKLGALLKTIPDPVMGGIMVLLFGMIAAIGINTLVRENVDMSNPRNLVIVAVVLVFGLGDMVIGVGKFQLAGIGLAGIVGVILNIIIPKTEKD